MAKNTSGRRPNSLLVIALAGLLLLAILAAIKILMEPQIVVHEDTPSVESSEGTADQPPEEASKTVIDYDRLETDEELQALMEQRKEDYDVGEGIDIIARSDETVRIGDRTVSMKELQREIQLKQGQIAEETIGPDGRPLVQMTESFGLYVVQPGDNIWDIHFRFLRDYFQRRGVSLAPTADEPVQGGFSSGVGKLLKFSENMVYIYNVKDKAFSENLDLIEPQSKIVVYKMDRVFAFLEQVDYTNINRIQFDGDTLWVPAQ